MEQWEVSLAKMFKERNNPKPIGVEIGKVVSGFPELVISIGNEILLDSSQLIIANCIYHMHDHDEYGSRKPIPLEVDDQVILLPMTHQQKYVLIDKVGEPFVPTN
jgi:Protein of unknown function (DUF2577)